MPVTKAMRWPSGESRPVDHIRQQCGLLAAGVHRFRDSFAIRFVENGGRGEDLQVILGHADIKVTMHYVDWNRKQRSVDAGRSFTPWAKRAGEEAPDELERITLRKLELTRAKSPEWARTPPELLTVR